MADASSLKTDTCSTRIHQRPQNFDLEKRSGASQTDDGSTNQEDRKITEGQANIGRLDAHQCGLTTWRPLLRAQFTCKKTRSQHGRAATSEKNVLQARPKLGDNLHRESHQGVCSHATDAKRSSH
jgi:hypothetical protein